MPPATKRNQAKQTAGRGVSRIGQNGDRQLLEPLARQAMSLAPESQAHVGVRIPANLGAGLLVSGQGLRFALGFRGRASRTDRQPDTRHKSRGCENMTGLPDQESIA